MATTNHYELLGLQRTATAAEIKKAYNKLALRYHPDLNKSPDAAERMIEINAAYEVLSDPKKRARYDETLRVERPSSRPRPTPRDDSPDKIDDMFGDILNVEFPNKERPSSRSRSTPPDDIQDKIDDVFGDILNVEFPKKR